MDEKEKLKKFCFEQGASLFGVADISGIKKDFRLDPAETENLDKAICIGFAMSKKVLSGVKGKPTNLYYHHYKHVNIFLDLLALQVVNILQKDGFYGLAIPATQIIDWKKQLAHLSHRQIGQLAGLGWVGRNNLLVNKDLGSNFRLVTILTDAPLEITPQPALNSCDSCRACVSACPAGAIKEKPEDFNHIACSEKISEFRRLGYTEQYICGICVKVCNGK